MPYALTPHTPVQARGWTRCATALHGGPLCYRTKRAALCAFIGDGHNAAVIDEWGGLARDAATRWQARQGPCAAFDPVNAGRTGRRRVCLLDDAIWTSLKRGYPGRWCLDDLDLDALNAVGRNLHGGRGRSLRLPDAAEEAVVGRAWGRR